MNREKPDPANVPTAATHSGAPIRVFISYAHDDAAHGERVRDFWLFLRTNGIDATVDLPAQDQRQDWAEWMTQQVRDAQYVLVIASPGYRRRAEGDAEPGEGRGVQWEARMIRDRFHADQKAGLREILPVVLPGCSVEDIPLWLGRTSTTHYQVSDYTISGAEDLLRLLTRQPRETERPLGPVPDLPPRDAGAGQQVGPRPTLNTEVLIEAARADNGQLNSTVWLAGAQLCQQQTWLPAEVAGVWAALQLPAPVATERMAEAGRKLAAALMDDHSQRQLGGLPSRLPPGDQVSVMLSAGGPALSLPVELIRLTTDTGVETGPLALLTSVAVSRRLAAPGEGPGLQPAAQRAGKGMPGPLKILAAVAAPDETKTRNVPLDVEAEMEAVLDAVTDVAGHRNAQVRILEVASLRPSGGPSKTMPTTYCTYPRTAHPRRWNWKTRMAPLPR